VSDDKIQLFEGYTLDLARGSVLREGVPVHLRPQSYEVLKYLVENRGRLVSKDKIIEDVWHGAAVTDGSLGKCIEEVRDALGEQAAKYVRNVRGRGYIFEAEANGIEKARSVSITSEQVDVFRVDYVDEGRTRRTLAPHTLRRRNENANSIMPLPSYYSRPRDLVATRFSPDAPLTRHESNQSPSFRSSTRAETLMSNICRTG